MRRRVLISILLVVAATVIALGVPLGLVSWNLVGDRAQADLLSRAESVSTSIDQQEGTGDQLDLRRLAVAVPTGGLLEVIQPGRAVQTVGNTGLTDRFSVGVALPDGGSVVVSEPAGVLRVQRRTAMLLVAAAVLLSLLVGTAIALVLARRLSQPLSDVAERAARLGAGDFRVSGDRSGIAELDRVAEVLDSSAADIAALIGRERDLAGDISHQLRSRLTGLRLLLEELSMATAAALPPDPGETEELIQGALDQTDQLVGVVDDLLAAARLRRAAGATEFSLATELTAVGQDWGKRLRALDRELTVEVPDGVMVHATPLRLHEALAALLDNALRHGAGRVTVRVGPGRPGDRSVLIEVADEGPGVPEALVGSIFERGVSTASSTGFGLGLARAFVEADGGRLELRRARPPVFGIFLAGGPESGEGSAVGQ